MTALNVLVIGALVIYCLNGLFTFIASIYATVVLKKNIKNVLEKVRKE